MVSVTMKVIEMDTSILRNYITGCKSIVQVEKKDGTYIEGYNRGIDDGLKVVDSEGDLTFVMRMAVLGLRHQHDNNKELLFSITDVVNYRVGYDHGIDDTVEIITGKNFR